MREIKFRAWDGIGNHGMQYFESLDEIAEYFRPHKFQEVMQFTGLKDKNGNEIYEGDILRCEDLEVIVEWSDDIAELGWILNSDGKSISWAGIDEHFEIVGNVYESPKLLEASNE